MKIENIDLDEFLKSEQFALSREKSNTLTKHKPSMKQKHIKQKRKVDLALQDLDLNHNCSWYDEIRSRYQECMDRPAIFYRGAEISGKEMFEHADKLASSLKVSGVKKGEEILACMSNVPEAVYLLLAASKCGAVVNFIGDGFDPAFIKQIIAEEERKIFIGTDDVYSKIREFIEAADFKHKVLISLVDSLPNKKDMYEEYDDKFYKFENKVPLYKSENSTISTYSEFENYSKNQSVSFPQVGIDDEFTVTYTSGSTKIGFPKEIVHKNRHYISIGRFHDPDLSRMPAMRNMRGLAHIPLHSNTNIVSSISDPLMQTCTVACEPIYNPRFFARSLVINEPGFVPATRSFFLQAVKDFQADPKLQDKKLGNAVNYVAVGEDIVCNEELYINKLFSNLEAGSSVLPKILTPITLSIGGGNCEHGGLFFTLFHSLRQKLAITRDGRREYGLTPFQLTDLAVLHEDGTECDYDEYGRLVANSPCTMKQYKNNDEANKKFYLTDAYDRVWGDCSVWAYVGKNGNVRMKGRLGNELTLDSGKKIPNFLINENVLDDLDNILSSEVVTVKSEDGVDVAVAHVELLPGCQMPLETVLGMAEKRCQDRFSEELSSKIVFKIRGNEDSFPLTKSGKRNVRSLELEGIDDLCVKPIFVDHGEVALMDATSYLKNQHTISKKMVKEKVIS